MILWYY